MKATVITDASYCAQVKVGGWAAWVRVDGVPEAIKHSGGFKTEPQSSTHAEVLAAINGIWLAVKHGASEILVQSDCLAVVHAIRKQLNPESPVMAFWSEGLARAEITGVILTARHVKGHTHNAGARFYVNRWCDEHAGHHMRKARSERHRNRKRDTQGGR